MDVSSTEVLVNVHRPEITIKNGDLGGSVVKFVVTWMVRYYNQERGRSSAYIVV